MLPELEVPLIILRPLSPLVVPITKLLPSPLKLPGDDVPIPKFPDASILALSAALT